MDIEENLGSCLLSNHGYATGFEDSASSIYLWREMFVSSSEAKHGGQLRPGVRQLSPPTRSYHVYMSRNDRVRGLRLRFSLDVVLVSSQV